MVQLFLSQYKIKKPTLNDLIIKEPTGEHLQIKSPLDIERFDGR
jgi:hypothetical protein